jgi:hypothetical protein
MRDRGSCVAQWHRERHDGARHFTGMTEEALRVRLSTLPGVNVVRLWTTHDARPDRVDEQWLNSLSSVTQQLRRATRALCDADQPARRPLTSSTPA